MIRGVLFDLDDTLFDHRQCARAALGELHRVYHALSRVSFEELARRHDTLLEALHGRVLTGDLPLEAAREERFRQLFETCGMQGDPSLAAGAARAYRETYQRSRRAVTGAARLLAAVRARAAVAIVSNNLLAEQQDKLECCGLDEYIEALIVSEEAGVAKPDPAIFHRALARLGVPAGAAVMIGDSWHADIAGARAAGIRAIWFNPQRQPRPQAAPDVRELTALEPIAPTLDLIFDGWDEASDPGPQDPVHADEQCA